MSVQSKSTVKSYFQRGLKPTQAQFGDLIDSYQDYSAVIEQVNLKASAGFTGFVDVQSNVSADLVPYGSVGLQVLQSQTATSAKQVLNIGAAVSAEFATTAQAIAGAVDGISMSPVLTRNAIQAWAFTSANYSTTAQAIAGTDATTVMNPVLVKNAVQSQTTNGLSLISVVTAAAVSAASFTNIDNTYKEYEIRFYDIVAGTNTVFPSMRTSTNNGASYDSGASDYGFTVFGYENATIRNNSSAAIDHLELSCRALDNTSNKGFSGIIRLYNPSGSSLHKGVLIDSISYAAAGIVRSNGMGFRLSTADVDAFQIYMSAGTFSGVVALYGVKK